jgi:hypothetical protein
MTVTSAPIGSTAQSLDGFAVDNHVVAAFREAVVLTGPDSSTQVVSPTSTQPTDAYGLPVWVEGVATVSVAAHPPTSTQIVSSIPFHVAQSSAPWDMRGGVAVTNTPSVALTGTSQVFGTVSTQIVSSIPFFVAQSSAPWDVRGGINISSQTAVSSSFPISTTMVNVVSSLPMFVSQSSAPWSFVEKTSTSGGLLSTTFTQLTSTNLNTTVIKAGAGQVYGAMLSNVGSTNVFIRLYAASAAANVIASTAVPMMIVAATASTFANPMMDVGVAFSTGIAMIAQREPWTASTATPIAASTTALTIFYA